MKQLRKQRVGRILVEEREENGVRTVFSNGEARPGSFHEAVVAAKQAPLIKIRDTCLRLAEEARAAIEDEPEEELPQPIGRCQHCGTPVYTDVGFCGACGR